MYGEILKNLRIEHKLTQQQLAAILGFKSASAAGMLEREERELSIETIIRITNHFNISSDYLMGLVPFKIETEAYHSICVASVKYLREQLLKSPSGVKSYRAYAKLPDKGLAPEIKPYCEKLLADFKANAVLTDLQLFELSNILFLNIKWSPDFNGPVQLEDFNGEVFSINLDYKKIDKLTLDLNHSILFNYKAGSSNLVKYTSLLNSSSREADNLEREASLKSDSEGHAPDNSGSKEDFHKDIEVFENFGDAEQALKFILAQPELAAYGGYDLHEMSDEEIIEIANDMLFAMRLSLEKLKRKYK
jgi:transcriptional regulator with XRE-family HTH domain